MSSSPAPDPSTVLDEQALARLHEDFASTGDLDELAALIRNFVDRGGRQIDALTAAAASGDMEAVRQGAHKLKGSSQTLGATLLGAAAADLEAAAGAGRVDAAVVSELERAFAATRAALEEVVASIGA